MTISASTPASRAAHATACAWLPAEIEITPARFSSPVSCESLFSAPRTLNEPVRWKSSALKRTSPPSCAESVPEPSTNRTLAPIAFVQVEALEGVLALLRLEAWARVLDAQQPRRRDDPDLA